MPIINSISLDRIRRNQRRFNAAKCRDGGVGLASSNGRAWSRTSISTSYQDRVLRCSEASIAVVVNRQGGTVPFTPWLNLDPVPCPLICRR